MNQKWKEFIGTLGTQSQIFVVGPMHNRMFSPSAPTIFVDGGTHWRPIGDSDKSMHISVGDGDSGGALDVTLPAEKDYSDLAFVLNNLPASVRHVELIGFLGGRRDHELFNYGEVHKFLSSRRVFSTVRFDEAIVAFAGASLKMEINGTFSLAVLEESEVRVIGACKYPLNHPTKIGPASSLGLSNHGQGTVVVESSKPCFLFLS